MFEPIKISIPAEKFTEDVYIIIEKLEGEVKTSENSRYYTENGDKTYCASKALKETYTVIMPTQEQQKTVTCYGTDGKVVTPFEGLYFRTIEEVTSKLDEINNRKAQAVFMILIDTYDGAKYLDANVSENRRKTIQRLLPKITKNNLYHYLSQLITINDIERAVYRMRLLEKQDLKDN